MPGSFMYRPRGLIDHKDLVTALGSEDITPALTRYGVTDGRCCKEIIQKKQRGRRISRPRARFGPELRPQALSIFLWFCAWVWRVFPAPQSAPQGLRSRRRAFSAMAAHRLEFFAGHQIAVGQPAVNQAGKCGLGLLPRALCHALALVTSCDRSSNTLFSVCMAGPFMNSLTYMCAGGAILKVDFGRRPVALNWPMRRPQFPFPIYRPRSFRSLWRH